MGSATMTTMFTPSFDSDFSRLNDEQKAAVTTIEGPVMVIAGPGTGKTEVLTMRVANILKQTDTQPSSVLALTYTEAAATTMRQRLFEKVGSAAYQVRIQTFHAFCNDVILSHPEYFHLHDEAEPVTELAVAEFLREYLLNPELEYLRTPRSAFHNVRSIGSALSGIKKEGLSVDDFEKLVVVERALFESEQAELSTTKRSRAQKRVGTMEELVEVYRAYQRFLDDNAHYDYEDMILWVISAFEREPELLVEYQEQLHYFLVDEYQDTNSAQNKIVDAIASHWGEQANVFVVGDPNQTIYRFQGASLENVITFVERYPSATVITLEDGYRCSQQIYDAAAHTIRGELEDLPLSPALSTVLSKPLASTRQGEVIPLLKAESSSQEVATVVAQLQQYHQQGTPLQEIAIIYKKHKEAQRWMDALDAAGLQYTTQRHENILESRIIIQLLELFEVILAMKRGEPAHQLHDVLLAEWLELDASVVLKLAYAAAKCRPKLSLHEFMMERVPSEKAPAGLTPLEIQPLYGCLDTLSKLIKADANMRFVEWFPYMLEQLGVSAWLVAGGAQPEDIQRVQALYREIKSLEATESKLNLERFMAIIQAMQDNSLSIQQRIALGSEDGIVLTTAHGAKGKEWRYVFITNCADKVWGNARSPRELPLPDSVLQFKPSSKADKNADDRRLMYVSLTRAREQVHISVPLLDEESSKEQTVSMFVGELEEQESLGVWKPDGDASSLDQPKWLLPSYSVQDSMAFRSWVQILAKNLVLSPTALDSYLRDSDTFLENNILRLPRAKTYPLSFGTAIHAALEFAFRTLHTQGLLPNDQEVLTHFKNALSDEHLHPNDERSAHKEGKAVLGAYLAAQHSLSAQPQIKMLEYTFGQGGREVLLDDTIRLTGKVDRVDWLDASKKTLVVIDYKTGSPKTAAYIEGTLASQQQYFSDREKLVPETIRGSLKRQLVFYKLLADLDQSFEGQVTHGELDFVAGPSDKGKSGAVRFELLASDVEDLKDVLRTVSAEIRSLAFLD